MAFSLFTLTASVAQTAENAVITNAAELSDVIFRQSGVGRDFALDAEVVAPTIPGNTTLAVRDKTGAVALNLGSRPQSEKLRGGDRIRVTGKIAMKGNGQVFADCNAAKVVEHGAAPAAADISPEDFLRGDRQGELVRLSGIVTDTFYDEIDPEYMFMIMNCGGSKVYAAFKTSIDGIQPPIEDLIGQVVSVEGVSIPLRRGGKQLVGRGVLIYRKSDIKILSTSFDPFDAPELGDLFNLTPEEISNLGRRKTSGRVIAAYGRKSVVVRTEDGRIVRAELARSGLPEFGRTIQIAGFPECDLYHINISRAVWREATGDDGPADVPTFATAKSLLSDTDGMPRLNHLMHGRTVRMRGTVLSVPGVGGDDGRFYMKDGDFIVPVNVSAVPDAMRDVRIGCLIEVTGACIMESENWRPNSVFPQIKGFMIVVRAADDIRVLSEPSRWTPARLIAVIGALLAAPFGIFAWNRILNRRAERRGKELAAEQVAHVTSDLKVYERTRLAVELHDSLSQNLTGVSLAIRAADRLSGSDPDGMRRSLALAARTLDSCRDELRNCLWDLRNMTLEESDMNDAIRHTLAPHIGAARLSVRFSVPRDSLSDNTAHAILRIVRELASNAIRHGKATAVKIAGAIEGVRLMLSVSDNGCGFDPQTAPGIRQGHFGLQGIRDRIAGFEGEMSVASAPGAGTKVTIAIKAAAGGSARPTRLESKQR